MNNRLHYKLKQSSMHPASYQQGSAAEPNMPLDAATQLIRGQQAIYPPTLAGRAVR